MVDQHATAVPTPTFPSGRYGRRRSPRRRRPWLGALVAVAITAAAAGLGWRLYAQYGNPDHRGLITSELERTSDHVTFRYEVRNRPGTGAAVCQIKAAAGDGAVVGQATIVVAAGSRVQGTFTLPVTARPANVEIVRCTTAPGDR